MRSLSVRLGAAVLIVAAVQAPRPARAFGLHFGPIYLHLPFRGGHRHKRIARSEPTAIAAPAALPLANDDIASGTSPTLLYPALAWPSLYDAIFEPGTSSWPFGYQTIFDQAFMKFVSQQTSRFVPVSRHGSARGDADNPADGANGRAKNPAGKIGDRARSGEWLSG
ncbi:MAG: hypothetical protein ACLPXW_16700 [Xanthobacteraceae bacterium]